MNPLPIGVPGELHIGGVGLARGYWKRPELTAEKFIPHPFNSEPGARLYKTGDLARWLPDGVLEYLGRLDHQVKLRGFRIELGEIETVLRQHPHSREAVVLCRETDGTEKRLVAYVVTESPQATAAEFRTYLQERLPAYMVPAAFVLLDALPLTANGKVDRRALPAPVSRSTANAYTAPRTPVEEKLAAIWTEVLGLPRVGVHDDFFDSGGHSLLTIRVLSRVRDVFNIDLPLRGLFDSPTVAGMANHLMQHLTDAVTPDEERLLWEMLEETMSKEV
jgi:hypothetical protein